MSTLKARVKATADGRFRPLLTYGDGVKTYGPRLPFTTAVKRARDALHAHRRHVLICKGIETEAAERAREYDRGRPMRVYFASLQ